MTATATEKQMRIGTENGCTVVWQDAIPGGQVVTIRRADGLFVSRIIGGPLDGWEEPASNLRRSRICHDGLIAMGRGIASHQDGVAWGMEQLLTQVHMQ